MVMQLKAKNRLVLILDMFKYVIKCVLLSESFPTQHNATNFVFVGLLNYLEYLPCFSFCLPQNPNRVRGLWSTLSCLNIQIISPCKGKKGITFEI